MSFPTSKVPKTRIRGKRKLQPTSSETVAAENSTPSVSANRLHIQGTCVPQPRTSLIPAIQLLERGCGQAAEGAVLQNYMEDARKLAASLIPSDPEAGSSGAGNSAMQNDSTQLGVDEQISWGVASIAGMQTRIRGKRRVQPTSSQAGDASAGSAQTLQNVGLDGASRLSPAFRPDAPCAVAMQVDPAQSVTVKRIRLQGKQANVSQPRTSLIPAIQLLESGCGQAAEAAVLQYYMDNAKRLAASVSPSDPEVGPHPEAGSSNTPTAADTSIFSRSSGVTPTPSHAARLAQNVGPGRVSRLSQAFRSDASRNVAMQMVPTQLGDDERISVGAASVAEIPADLRRRAKAGDDRIHVVEDSAASSDNL